jgi:hypothetical protein
MFHEEDRMKIRNISATIFIAFLLGACSGGKEAAATATREAEDTAVAVGVAQTQAASDIIAFTADAIAAQTQSVFQNKTATGDALQAALTQKAVEIQAERTANVAAATSAAQPMMDLITQLSDEGILSTPNGRLTQLEDFHRSWAQIDWFTWYPSGHHPSNFVVKAKIAWETASDKANWYNSGCGFVFREDSSGDNFYAVYLALDGWVRMLRLVSGNLGHSGSSFYGKVDIPKGNADFMLIVDGNKIRAFVNDEMVFEKIDNAFSEGRLSFMLHSGTNKDFGTRCDMTDIWLWEIE